MFFIKKNMLSYCHDYEDIPDNIEDVKILSIMNAIEQEDEHFLSNPTMNLFIKNDLKNQNIYHTKWLIKYLDLTTHDITKYNFNIFTRLCVYLESFDTWKNLNDVRKLFLILICQKFNVDINSILNSDEQLHISYDDFEIINSKYFRYDGKFFLDLYAKLSTILQYDNDINILFSLIFDVSQIRYLTKHNKYILFIYMISPHLAINYYIPDISEENEFNQLIFKNISHMSTKYLNESNLLDIISKTNQSQQIIILSALVRNNLKLFKKITHKLSFHVLEALCEKNISKQNNIYDIYYSVSDEFKKKLIRKNQMFLSYFTQTEISKIKRLELFKTKIYQTNKTKEYDLNTIDLCYLIKSFDVITLKIEEKIIQIILDLLDTGSIKKDQICLNILSINHLKFSKCFLTKIIQIYPLSISMINYLDNFDIIVENMNLLQDYKKNIKVGRNNK